VIEGAGIVTEGGVSGSATSLFLQEIVKIEMAMKANSIREKFHFIPVT
jgi:hypothetical protein